MTGWLGGLEERARTVLPAPVAEYVAQGARESLTTAAAVGAWREHRFLPHVLRDVTDVDPGVELLGRRSELPWGVAPTTLQRAVHPEGELAMARATHAAGGLVVVSSNAGTPFAEIGETGARWWLQAYLPADRTLAEPMLARARDAGAEAVVLTVDTPVVATKYAAGESVWATVDPGLVRVNFGPDHEGRPGADKATDLGPHDLDWLRETAGLPVVVKGVLRPDDARRCVEAGAAAVWVSNHGGRQLDRAATTAHALPAVAAEVGADAEVYVDGGLRTGLDVLTALALGADAAFLGRPPLWALAEGETGVARLHAELLEETVEALRLAGCRTVADTRGLLATPPVPGA
ncbi:alpha-hydroxy-acid oxidizing enzyme [Nocardioides sp. zg-579]|uniref:Alpha-hydroxy-acid oxidizing enzyme n=1 Tax=Nocardioides marmotae TaxID=2663857 RepID=A0A6I3JFX5_9ACTN|nr:alpha-hydroxy acid oxidase [Nocardioides marmotae]MCR6033516.1 alpha-hydroxy-acid oxidizing enzyme [Gordonia jinghuaiqii]MTB97174.1 alpha-hydroxy-acid oxidizing enzyme [Nocardioides marmotae]QKE02093.1 alpha-hydroxy-acid oxidizing protein [Nocardioides marmotae]